MATAGLAPQYGREKLNHRRAADRPAFVEPGAVAGDPHAAMAAMARVPAFHGGQPPLLRQPGDIGERQRGEIGGDTCGHGRGLGDRRVERKARSEGHTYELQSPMRTSYSVFCL